MTLTADIETPSCVNSARYYGNLIYIVFFVYFYIFVLYIKQSYINSARYCGNLIYIVFCIVAGSGKWKTVSATVQTWSDQ